jgi:serine protease inhibitor
MKNKTPLSILALTIMVSITMLLSGCKTVIHADDSGVTPDGITAAVKANNQFAFKLYSEYAAKDSNVFFSPYSISTAVAMTYEGAKGKTAQEMQSVFQFPADSVSRRSAFASIYNEINKDGKNYKLSTANALWAQKDYPFLADYLKTTENYYGGKVTNMDFVAEPEKSRLIINKWVEDQTNNKIKDLLSPGDIHDMTRLVLTNAIYFKGKWHLQFEKKDTEERDFKISPQSTIKTQMMKLQGEKALFNYAENDNYQMIELAYQGDEVSMVIVLPVENSDATTSIDEQSFNELKASMKKQKVNVFIPRFKFETKYMMADDLKKLGMPTAFDSSQADFSGMTGNDDLYIDKIIHQAYIDVNEEGTEAAAATGIAMAGKAMPSEPIIFNADHPFMFVIQQKSNGNILFMGRVNDPTQ